MYGSTLPVTGVAGLTLFGYELGLGWVAGAATVMVIAGVLMYRWGSRVKARARA